MRAMASTATSERAGGPAWWSRVALAVLAGLATAGRGHAVDVPPREVVVYAAASLRDVLESLREPAERELGLRPVHAFGATSDLARQIVAAAKADVFFSADEASMDRVDAAGLVDRTSRRSLLGNGLVVVAPADSALQLSRPRPLVEAPIRTLSLADPEVVPAGKYARAWLEATGQWDAVRDRVVPALDVRAALAAVAAGATDAGVVYRTDARLEPAVRVVLEIPEADGPAISYPVAAIAGRPGLEDARRFVAWLAAPARAAVFAGFGFTVRAAPAVP